MFRLSTDYKLRVCVEQGANCLAYHRAVVHEQNFLLRHWKKVDVRGRQVSHETSLTLNSASDASELTECKRKRKCRNDDEYDSSLKVHSCPRFQGAYQNH